MTNEEMDRLCAEKVMGWTYNPKLLYHGEKIGYDAGYDEPFLPTYSYTPTRNIAQAWELLEKMEGHVWDVWRLGGNMSFACRITKWDSMEVLSHENGETAPLAIVRAVLKAKWGWLAKVIVFF